MIFKGAIAIVDPVRAHEAGLRIPRAPLIVGCGNYHYSNNLRLSLLSVHQRAAERREA